MAFIELMIKLNKSLESRQMGKQEFNQTKKYWVFYWLFFCSNSNTHGNKCRRTPSQQQLTATIQHRASSQIALSNRYCVWLNLRTYVCQKEADQAGDRATRGM
jgi:hypothetical protein